MKSPAEPCLSSEQLHALALGLETDERLEQLAAHVESCSGCLAALERAEARDRVTLALRSTDSTREDFSAEPAFHRMSEHLRALAPKCAATVRIEPSAPHETDANDSPTNATRAASPLEQPFVAFPVRFGRYRVSGKLGKGGMGAVYRAWDTQLERDVALKVPTAGLDSGGAKHFLREARAAAALDHPFICPIYDYGQIDGLPYLTLKFIEGQTLADVLDQGPLPVRDAVALCRQIAEALDAAHRAGVTHRDLKPSNIMLDGAGQPCVMDFGLARREAVDSIHIQQGEIFGTPVYMSPEQAEGQGDAVGAPSDIYSLGVMLYETLAGRPPFSGNVAKVLEKIRYEAPAPPSRHRPEIDARLDAICLKALAKQPQDRYATVGEFAAALRMYLQTLPAPMPGLERGADDERLLRRQRRMRWLLTVAALVLIGVLGFLSLGGGRIIAEVAKAVVFAKAAPRTTDRSKPQSATAVRATGDAPDSVAPTGEPPLLPGDSPPQLARVEPPAPPPNDVALADAASVRVQLGHEPLLVEPRLAALPAEAVDLRLLSPARGSVRPRRQHEPGTLGEAVQALAVAIADYLQNDAGSRQVHVGSFLAAQPELAAGSGVGIRRMLAEELTDLGIEIQPGRARYSCRGEFAFLADGADAGRVTLDVVLRENEVNRKTISREIFSPSDIASLMGATGKLSPTSQQRSAALVASIQDPQPQLAPSPVAETDGQNVRALAAADADYAVELWRLKAEIGDVEQPTEADYEPVSLVLEDGQPFADLQARNRYAVRLVNNTNQLAACTLTIDGLNLFAFSEVDAYRQLGKVLVPPGPKGVLIRGWHRTNQESIPFEVKPVGESAVDEARAVGAPYEEEIGVITACFAAAADVAKGETLPPDEPRMASLGTAAGPLAETSPRDAQVKIGLDREVVTIRYAHPLP